MERPSYDELISAYFDDETSPEENVVVEGLLADPKFRQELEDYRQLRDELRSMPAPRLDAGWSARLKRRLGTATPDWAAKSVAAASPDSVVGTVSPDRDSVSRAEAGGSMRASLEASRGDGYGRFRQAWLTAGVGVAAGTLGIVIGWSAQNLAPGELAYDAPVTTASPALTNAPLPMSREAEVSQNGSVLRKTSEFTVDHEQFHVPSPAEPVPDFAGAPTGAAAPSGGPSFADEAGAYSDPAATFGSQPSQATGVENGPQTARSETIAARGGPPVVARQLTADAVTERNKTEKQNAVAGATIPGVQQWVDPSSVPETLESEELLHDPSGRADASSYYATYVGVWDSNADDLAADRIRGLTRQTIGAATYARERVDLADASLDEDSLTMTDGPALVLEGSPERVAEALEVLSRGRSSREVRLVKRDDDPSVLAYEERARGLYERQSNLEAQQAAADTQSQLNLQSAIDARGEGEIERRSETDGETQESLAFGTKESPSFSAIDRIEAFFRDSSKDESSSAGVAAGGALAGGGGLGGFGYGGGGGRLGEEGFGGLGGAAPANGPASMPMLADAAAAGSDAFDVPVERPSVQIGAAPMATAPIATMPAALAASPEPVAADDRAERSIAGSGPAAAPTSGPDRPRSEAAGVAGASQPPALAMAEEPVPPAPAPASTIAENATPPAPAEAAPADAANPSDVDGSADKKEDRYAEGSGSGSMRFARGALTDGEAGAGPLPAAQLAPAAQPVPPAPSGAGGRAQAMGEDDVALEQLREEAEARGDRSWMAREFVTRSPERVRVVLYAADALALRSGAAGVQAGSAPALAPVIPGGPAIASPAADATPIESAPGSDR